MDAAWNSVEGKYQPRPLPLNENNSPLHRAGISQIFVISIKDSAYETALQNLQRVGIHRKFVQRWNGVVGKELFNARNEAKRPLTNDLLSFNTMVSLKDGHIGEIHSPGAAGCAFSHIGIWKHIVKHNLPAVLVFEDDVERACMFKSSFSPMLTLTVASCNNLVGSLLSLLEETKWNFDVIMLQYIAFGFHPETTQEWSKNILRTFGPGPGGCTQAYVLLFFLSTSSLTRWQIYHHESRRTEAAEVCAAYMHDCRWIYVLLCSDASIHISNVAN